MTSWKFPTVNEDVSPIKNWIGVFPASHVTLLGTNISHQITFERDFPFPKVGYVRSLEGSFRGCTKLSRLVNLFPSM